MRKSILASLLTGLALVDYTQAVIPRHIVRNYLAKKADSAAADNTAVTTIPDNGLPLNTVVYVTKPGAGSLSDPTATGPSTDPFTNSVAFTTLPCNLTLSDGPTGVGCPVATGTAASSNGAVSSLATPSTIPASGEAPPSSVPASGEAPSNTISPSSEATSSGGGLLSGIGGVLTSLDATLSNILTSSPVTTAPGGSSTGTSASSQSSGSGGLLSGIGGVLTSLDATLSKIATSPDATNTPESSADSSVPSGATSSNGPASTAAGQTGAVSSGGSPSATPPPGSSALPPVTTPVASSLDFISSSFVVSGSITIPPQTATETGSFDTTTLTDHTGPPGSFSATTTTDSNHNPVIFPVWFNTGGFPVLVIPKGDNGPPGIIPPPVGFPPVVIDPEGNPVADPEGGSNPESDPTPTDDPQTGTNTASESDPTSTDASSQTSSSSSSSTSSGATESPSPFLIFPKDSASQSDKASFESELANEIGGESNIIDIVTDSETGVRFWSAPLNSTQVENFSQNPIIQSIFADQDLDVDDTDDIVDGTNETDSGPTTSGDNTSDVARRELFARDVKSPQLDARPELAVLSQAKDPQDPTKAAPLTNEYLFDDTAGSGITVYIIDSGANTDHTQYKTLAGPKRFLIPSENADQDQDDKSGHGSCVLSMVSTPLFGAAKQVSNVIVKMQVKIKKNFNWSTTFAAFEAALQAVANDVTDKGLQGKAVLNMSFGIATLTDDEQQEIKKLIQKLVDNDVVVVIASGNSANAEPPRLEVDTFPGLFAKDIPSLIVVGAVDNQGVVAAFSQGGPLVQVWAPGKGVFCMTRTGQEGNDGNAVQEQVDEDTGITKHPSGTSYAAPKVAGIAALLMANPATSGLFTTGNVAQQVKDRIIGMAWARKTSTSGTDVTVDPILPVAWNEQSASCGGGAKRDDSGACSLADLSSAATSAATSAASASPSSSVPTTLSTVTTVAPIPPPPPPPPPPATTTQEQSPTSVQPAPTSFNTNDPNCIECETNLGDSNCAADDNQCLLDQCHADSGCQACANFDCNAVIGG